MSDRIALYATKTQFCSLPPRSTEPTETRGSKPTATVSAAAAPRGATPGRPAGEAAAATAATSRPSPAWDELHKHRSSGKTGSQ